MFTMLQGIMELQYKIQNYDWGKLGKDSMVAKLLSSADSSVTIDPDKPYAELWMGTHPNGPSLIIERNVLLSEYIQDNLDAIGPVVKKRFGVAVPFLFKILSIGKALSVQAHPNKVIIYSFINHDLIFNITFEIYIELCGELKHCKEVCTNLESNSMVSVKFSI